VKGLARRRRISIEEAGRLVRYSFFFRVARRTGARLVAVGHTRDDQAETVLMRLLRGASMSGLAGISPRRGLIDPLSPRHGGAAVEVIRPLLARSRAEIEAFLRLKRIRPRIDPSNASPDFLRNRIRRDLVPLLERAYNPNIRAVLAHAASVLAEEDAFLEAGAVAAFRRIARVRGRRNTILPLRALGRLPLPVRRRVLRLAVVGAGVNPNRLAQAHLDALVRLAGAGAGETHLPGLRASAAGGVLRLDGRR
jgi:tRNA(Ile)-lysidine synthase